MTILPSLCYILLIAKLYKDSKSAHAYNLELALFPT
jgi:hypothetical protein